MAHQEDRMIWRAGPDGIEHGHAPGGTKTVCGRLLIPERLQWPTQTRCGACEPRKGPS